MSLTVFANQGSMRHRVNPATPTRRNYSLYCQVCVQFWCRLDPVATRSVQLFSLPSSSDPVEPEASAPGSTPAPGAPGPHDFTVRTYPARGRRASCVPPSSSEASQQRRSSARRSLTEFNLPRDPPRARRGRVHRIPPCIRDASRSAPCRVRRANC